MGAGVGGHVDVDHPRDGFLHPAVDGAHAGQAPEHQVFPARGEDVVVDGVAAHGQGRHAHDRLGADAHVVAGPLAEGAFEPGLVRGELSLDDDLGVGGHHEVHGLGLDELDGLLQQRARLGELPADPRQPGDRAEHERGVVPDGQGELGGLAPFRAAPVDVAAVVAALEIDTEGVRVMDLVAVDPGVLDARIRVLEDQDSAGDVGTGVELVVERDGQGGQVGRVPLEHHLLHRTVGHGLRGDGTGLPFAVHPRHVRHAGVQGQGQPLVGGRQVDGQGHGRAFHVGEEQRRKPPFLAQPRGDGGDVEPAVHPPGDHAELVRGRVRQLLDERAQILCHSWGPFVAADAGRAFRPSRACGRRFGGRCLKSGSLYHRR